MFCASLLTVQHRADCSLNQLGVHLCSSFFSSLSKQSPPTHPPNSPPSSGPLCPPPPQLSPFDSFATSVKGPVFEIFKEAHQTVRYVFWPLSGGLKNGSARHQLYTFINVFMAVCSAVTNMEIINQVKLYTLDL